MNVTNKRFESKIMDVFTLCGSMGHTNVKDSSMLA